MHRLISSLILLGDFIVTVIIIGKVPYTEIDWGAYMEQAEGFQRGERDYAMLKGGTGPLVYPAGFLYLFTVLRYITGGHIQPAQFIFAAVYFATQALVLRLYIASGTVPPYMLPLLALSKRMHSIYSLRLFNDCWAMLAAHVALYLLACRNWAAAIVAFSAAVSVKMNVLLFAPGVAVVCLLGAMRNAVLLGVALGVALQLALGLPFLLHSPSSYLSRAFEFSRVFMYKWTVNWKMLPESVFLSPVFSAVLLCLHVTLLLLFIEFRWTKSRGGFRRVWRDFWAGGPRAHLSTQAVLSAALVSNFIGIVFARSLHYQFYSWYFHSLPFLASLSRAPAVAKVAVWAAIEVCWNVFPATAASSSILAASHLLLLLSVWMSGL